MASHEPFGHLQPKLWAKEGPGVKLAVWLPTTKSRESTSSRCPILECDMELKFFWGELQLWFRPRFDLTLQSGVMSCQSPGIPTQDSFGTPTWESWEKVPFGCSFGGELQRILYGGKWWFPPSSGRGESCVKVPVACPNTQGCSRMLTNPLVIGFGCRFKLDNLVPLPSLIPGLLAHPSTPF